MPSVGLPSVGMPSSGPRCSSREFGLPKHEYSRLVDAAAWLGLHQPVRSAWTFGAVAIAVVVGIASMPGCKKAEASPQTRELFTNTCSRCHGPDGAGGLPLWDAGPSPQNFHDP